MTSIVVETLVFMLIVGSLWYLLSRRGRVGQSEELTRGDRIAQSILYALLSGILFQVFRYVYSLFLPAP